MIRRELFTDYRSAFSGIIGQEHAKLHLASALIAHRNIIISGPPGIGKTSMAKTVASLLDEVVVNECGYNCSPKSPACPICLDAQKHAITMPTRSVPGIERFVRVQGSPDLTPEDLIGDIDPSVALTKGPFSIEAFTPGKIFRANRGVLFFDEINRAPERLQNALLQVLEERSATIGSYRVDLPANFILIGTMNPKDSSTEKLSEVFLDRFDIIEMSYPESVVEEEGIIGTLTIDPQFPDQLRTSTVMFVQGLRRHKDVLFGPSVRGTIGLFERASSHAFLQGRSQVMLEDVHAVVASVLGHRIVLKPSAGFGTSKFDFVMDRFEEFMSGSDRSDRLRPSPI